MKLLILTLLLSFNAFADFPKNNLWISSDDKRSSKITERDFKRVIDLIEASYKPIYKNIGGDFSIDANWNDGTVNAEAGKNGNYYFIKLFGGMARHHLLTLDGYAMVICHEIGHHLGGAPKTTTDIVNWASVEGQADYFATLKCFKKVFESDDNISIVKSLNIPKVVRHRCHDIYSNENDAALCMRSSVASFHVTLLLHQLANEKSSLPSFKEKDSSIVYKTDENHPRSQCRLDTFFEGALCDNQLPLSNTDALMGTCNRKDGFKNGVRPLCWYFPAT